MESLKVNSISTLAHAIERVRELFKRKRYLTIKIVAGKHRSLSLNALSHIWYAKVAKDEGEYDEEEVKCLCKYNKGLGILRGDDEDFNEYCVMVIDHLPYENKVLAMRYIPVTSMMNNEQMMRYMIAVQANYFGRVNLQFPEKDDAKTTQTKK